VVEADVVEVVVLVAKIDAVEPELVVEEELDVEIEVEEEG
jgi:hypothetical protein